MDQNLQKCTRFADRSKSNLGLFLVKIYEFLKIKEKFGRKVGETQIKSMATVALIPYVVGAVPIFMDLGGISGGGGRTRRTRRGLEIQTHTHTQIGLSSLARTTNSIEVARKDLSVEVPQKDRRIESKRSRRVKRSRLVEVQAKDLMQPDLRSSPHHMLHRQDDTPR